MTSATTRPSPEDILKRWDALLKDPLLSFESLKRKGVDGHLESSLRSLCWRYYFALLPSPSSISASPPTTSTFSTYSLLLARQRSEYDELRERYLRAPDGGWMKDGETSDGTSTSDVKSSRGETNVAGVSQEKKPVKVDVKVNNPLGLEEDNPWQSWFADLELRKTIRQDVQRTFPEIEYFRQSATQDRLTDLLFVFCKLTPNIGYRQGMHELLAPILWVVDFDSLVPADEGDSLPHLVLAQPFVEHDTWSLFSALMKSCGAFYDHKAMIPLTRTPQYQPRPTGLGLSSVASPAPSATTLVQPIVAIATHLHSLLATLDPPLHLAFSRLQIEPQLYAIRWLRLLFSREFPLSETLALWDGIFARDPSLQITQHVAAAMLLRIRDSLITAERVGGYGEFLQVLLRYPACPDGTFRTPLLLAQAVYLRDNLSQEGADFVRRQNHQLGVIQPHDDHPDEETDLRTAAARGLRGQRKVLANASSGGGVGLLGEGGLVGDLAKGVYGRAEALGINRAILGTFNDIRRGVSAAQAQIEEQRQRQQSQFSQIPNKAPWQVEAGPSSTTRDALAELKRMRASGVAMAEALDLCVNVLEKALSPPTPAPASNPQFVQSQEMPNGEPVSKSSRSSTASSASSLAPQVMAITALKHVRDVLGGHASTFDSSVLVPLHQTLDLLAKSPPLPPLPSDSPSLSVGAVEYSPTEPPPRSNSPTADESFPSVGSTSLPNSQKPSVSPQRLKPGSESSTSSPSLPPAPAPASASTLSTFAGSRSDKPLPMLTRVPVAPKPSAPSPTLATTTPPKYTVSDRSSHSPSPLLTSYAPSSTASSPSRSSASTRNPPSPSSSSPFDPLGVM